MKPALFWLLLLLSATFLRSEATLEASGELASATRDKRGDTIGGIGSGIARTEDGLFLCTSDRGPGDGAIPYSPRLVTLKIVQDGATLKPELISSAVLRDDNGREMTGLIPDDSQASFPRIKDGRRCIDPEALSLAPDGTVYISDEYGPLLYQFTREGRMLRSISLPEEFTPRTADGRIQFTDKAPLASGRNINQGAEGMCILPDGKRAALVFQSGTVQAGGHDSKTTRLIIIDLTNGAQLAAYEYPFSAEIPGAGTALKPSDLSVNDLAALDENRFLVLERDGSGRNGEQHPPVARYKSVWLAELTADGLRKTFLFNLAALAPDPAKLAAKWEGLALLPSEDPTKISIIMSADNDYLTPVIYEQGREHSFPRVQDSVPAQFWKIQVSIPSR